MQGFCSSCKHNKRIHGGYVMCRSRQHAAMMDMRPTLLGEGAHQVAMRRHKFMSLKTAESIGLVCPSWEGKT